jgi:hypothetical protein
MTKNKEIIDFDFGFSFIDDEIEEVKETAIKLESAHANDQAAIEDLQERLNRLYNSIVPFLDNLCRNPEKSTIYWPDRVKKIEAYKDKLLSIIEGR